MKLPNGATLSLATTLGTATNVTAISAASPAVASASAGHAFAVGDVGILACAWGNLNGQVVKIGAVSTNDLTLTGVDTTDTNRFPSGGGVGTLQEVTAWTPLPGVMDFTTNGGDQQYTEVQFLESDVIEQQPTVRSALSLSLQLADEPTAAWYVALRKASDSRTPTPLSLTLRDGSAIYYNGIISMAPSPKVSVNTVMSIAVNIAIKAAGVSRF